MTTFRPMPMAVHIVFESNDCLWGVTPQAEGDAESPGSGGAFALYLRRGSRVILRYKLALFGFYPWECRVEP